MSALPPKADVDRCHRDVCYVADGNLTYLPADLLDVHLPPNFYYDQQDLVTERQKGKQWNWSASRPYFLIDFAPDRPRM
jgi:hypothetical protein